MSYLRELETIQMSTSSVWNINTMECGAALRNAIYENYVEM